MAQLFHGFFAKQLKYGILLYYRLGLFCHGTIVSIFSKLWYGIINVESVAYFDNVLLTTKNIKECLNAILHFIHIYIISQIYIFHSLTSGAVTNLNKIKKNKVEKENHLKKIQAYNPTF